MNREDYLLKDLRKGNINALEELIKLYYPDILRYCISYLGDFQIAEDLTQETFIKVVKYMDKYIHKNKFRAFVYKIAKNTCLDYWRKKNKEPFMEEISYEEPFYESGFSEFIANEDFKSIIKLLNEEEREIIILRFVHELKIREIANILDLPMRTVQSKIRKILKRLKEDLKEEEYEE